MMEEPTPMPDATQSSSTSGYTPKNILITGGCGFMY